MEIRRDEEKNRLVLTSPATSNVHGQFHQQEVAPEPHLSAANHSPVVHAAPEPQSRAVIPAFKRGSPPAHLPPAQPIARQ